ncbi:MAG: hypothetical protein EA369_04845 [Bradymonadales bacterium]|nr:MAG: hypothetical protein EA369_04845 [Bradymonadales bacterium]
MNRILISSVLGLLSLALAWPEFSLADPSAVNRSIESMGMGHSGLAARGNHYSAALNPAGLADVTRARFEFPILVELPLNMGVANETRNYVRVVDRDSPTAEQRAALEKLLEKAATASNRARVLFNPSYSRSRWHIGMMLDMELDADLRLGGFGSNQLVEAGDSNMTAGLVLGSAYPFLDNSLQVGATLKALYRVSPFEDEAQRLDAILIGMNEGLEVKDQIIGDGVFSSKALGMGVDLGVKYWVPDSLTSNAPLRNFLSRWRPAVGLTWQDVGNTRFFRSGENRFPKDIPQSLSAGLAFHPEFGFAKFRLSADARNLNQKKEFLNHLHLGAEALLFGFWGIRAGLSQGYWTVGSGVNFRFFRFDAFITAEETGRFARLQEKRTFGVRIAGSF